MSWAMRHILPSRDDAAWLHAFGASMMLTVERQELEPQSDFKRDTLRHIIRQTGAHNKRTPQAEAEGCLGRSKNVNGKPN